MITVKGQLGQKEKQIVKELIEEIPDIYGDFYITKDNLRLYIRENLDLLFECLKFGDKIVFDEKYGIIFIYGWSDKSNRNYIKILSKDQQSADKLLKITLWNFGNIDLYAKIKLNNPIKEVLEKNNFSFLGNRGKEILLKRKAVKS